MAQPRLQLVRYGRARARVSVVERAQAVCVRGAFQRRHPPKLNRRARSAHDLGWGKSASASAGRRGLYVRYLHLQVCVLLACGERPGTRCKAVGAIPRSIIRRSHRRVLQLAHNGWSPLASPSLGGRTAPCPKPRAPVYALFEHGNVVAFYMSLFIGENHPSFRFLLNHPYPEVDYLMAPFHPEAEADEHRQSRSTRGYATPGIGCISGTSVIRNGSTGWSISRTDAGSSTSASIRPRCCRARIRRRTPRRSVSDWRASLLPRVNTSSSRGVLTRPTLAAGPGVGTSRSICKRASSPLALRSIDRPRQCIRRHVPRATSRDPVSAVRDLLHLRRSLPARYRHRGLGFRGVRARGSRVRRPQALRLLLRRIDPEPRGERSTFLPGDEHGHR